MKREGPSLLGEPPGMNAVANERTEPEELKGEEGGGEEGRREEGGGGGRREEEEGEGRRRNEGGGGRDGGRGMLGSQRFLT
jgi:hypothetical protein